MDIAQVGAKARAPPALDMEATTSTKRRKIAITNNVNTDQDLKFSPSSIVPLKNFSITASPAPEKRFSSHSDDESPASCCSSNGSFELHENRIITFSDLEVDSAQVETSTCNCGEQIRREMSLTSELRTNSQEVESVEKKLTTKNKSRCVLSTLQKMPTESELEEFFAAAEKDIQKRFSEKYNYDIVKDVPLEGRYEWVQLKP
ncbi:cyclin-dependent kinase inhibitor 7-like [Abrus precatorius]|uniref:Cyclin-dependent kinase inhibitor n=1 Tax=Abrus precatorius TaxID=3816 RepID=A0A8B8KUN0_ABRPR|nr:cyclin-dependent kinase inhibitor 7-like [Abrus precatorius]